MILRHVHLFTSSAPAAGPGPHQRLDPSLFTSSQAASTTRRCSTTCGDQSLRRSRSSTGGRSTHRAAARPHAPVSIAGDQSTIACAGHGTVSSLDAASSSTRPEDQHHPGQSTRPASSLGHSTAWAATAEALSHLFPRDEPSFQSRAEEDVVPADGAGIHFWSAMRPDRTPGGTLGTPSSLGLSLTALLRHDVKSESMAARATLCRPLSASIPCSMPPEALTGRRQNRRFTDKCSLSANMLGRGASPQQSSGVHAAATPRSEAGPGYLAPRPRVGWPDYAGSHAAEHSSPGPLGRTWGRT